MGEYRRAELRSPDPLCNPYLAFVLLIRAGMEGVAHNMQLPPAADLNLYTAPEEIRARYRRLPETWAEAKAAAAASDFIKGTSSCSDHPILYLTVQKARGKKHRKGGGQR